MTPEEYFSKCYSIPYSASAAIGEFGDPMNCYGFVYWFYKLCLGKELPDACVDSFDSINPYSYNEVVEPVDGDVVDLRTLNGVYATHVGVVYLDYVYHFTRDGLMSKNRHRMKNWIKGYYHVI